jgi:hypothetical protein
LHRSKREIAIDDASAERQLGAKPGLAGSDRDAQRLAQK